MDLGKELGNISKTSLRNKIIICVAVIFTIISEFFIFVTIAISVIYPFGKFADYGIEDASTPIIFMVLIIFIPYLVYSILSAECFGIIYENGLEVTDTKSKLKESIYYTEIEEFYTIYNINYIITTISIKKKDGNWIIFSKRNGGSLNWKEKLVNAFSDAVYPSYNDKFISGKKIPFSYYDKKIPTKSKLSLTKFFETTKPNTLYLSKKGIEVNGSFSKKDIDNLFPNNILLSKENVFLTLLKKLK